MIFYVIKTLQAITKNRAIFLTMVLSVVLYGFFYPAAYKAERSAHLPIIIVDESQSPISQKIINTISHSPSVQIYAISDDFLSAKAMIQKGDADAIIYLPATLSQSLVHHDVGGVGIYVSSAYFLRTQGVILALVDSLSAIVQDELASYAVGHKTVPVLVHKRPLFNPLSGYGSYIFPAVAPLIVHQTLLLGIGMLIASYRVQNWRASLPEFCAIVLVCLSIGCLACFYLFGFVFWWHDYPRGGNFWAMVVAVPIYVLAVVAVSLFLASFLDNEARAGQVLIVSSIGLFFLTGVPYPMTAMPAALQSLAYLLPSTHGVQLFVQLNQMGTDLAVVGKSLGFLLGVALVFLPLGYVRLHQCKK